MKVEFKFLTSYIKKDLPNFDKSIYFMHIPKSGGTTIDHIFAKLSIILKNFEYKRFKYEPKINKLKLKPLNEKNSKPQFITGHLDYNFTENLNNIFKFTIVREPISRILSHYKFKVHRLNKLPQEYSFETFIKDEVEKNRDNLITRHFTGLLNDSKKINSFDKEAAIRNINIFDKIGTIDNWDDIMSDILSTFGLPSVFYSKFQEYEYNFIYNLTKTDIDLINKNFQYDFEIYSKILKNVNNIKSKNNYQTNNKISIVSPYLKSENRLYTELELRKLIEKYNEV